MTFDGGWVMNVHRTTPFAAALLTLVCALFPNIATAQYSVAQCASVNNQLNEATDAIKRRVKEWTLLVNRHNKNAAELTNGCRTKETSELRKECQAKHMKEGLELVDREQKERAEVTKQRQKAISLWRENLSYCHEYMNRKAYIANLQGLAFDLNADKQPEEALGVAIKCLEIDAKDLSCLTNKADALTNLGRLSEATSVIDRATSLGAITEVEAAAKKRLQEVKLLLHHKEVMSKIYSSPTEVTLKKDGGTFVVPVLINGAITLDFTIDSGAADVTVPADVFSTLTRTGTINIEDVTGERTYVLADGAKTKGITFTIRSLRVGDKVVENVRGSVAPAQGGLLLGQSFLERFKSWSFDNTKRQLVLEPQ
jgi:clan AA aspartic protease (TIGR02281 family)